MIGVMIKLTHKEIVNFPYGNIVLISPIRTNEIIQYVAEVEPGSVPPEDDF